MNSQLQKTVKALDALTPSSRLEMIKDIRSLLSSDIIQVIDSHNTASVVFIIQQDLEKYVLKAECGAVDATNREISWYRAAKESSPAPECIHSSLSPHFSYLILEYIKDAVTLDDIVTTASYGEKELHDYIDLALLKSRQLFKDSAPVVKAPKSRTPPLNVASAA